MPIEERVVWAYVVVTVGVVVAYAVVVGRLLATTPAEQVAYQRPMLVALAAVVVLTVAGTVASAVVGTARAELARPGSGDGLGRSDERDLAIARTGDRVGYQVTSVLAVGALALTMAGAAHFWIAHALFVAFVVGGLAGAGVKLVGHRRG